MLQTKLAELLSSPLPKVHVHTSVTTAFVSHTALACHTGASSGRVALLATAIVADTEYMHLPQASPEAVQQVDVLCVFVNLTVSHYWQICIHVLETIRT